MPSARRTRPRILRLTTLGAVSIALLVAVGCSGGDGGTADGAPTPGQVAATEALEAGRTVIDVRTPEEYEAGHVEGATLIDVQGPDFDQLVAELDPNDDYVVYCRSGNRSAIAAARMAADGLDVWDGGGLDDMEAAGWQSTTG